MTPQAWHLKPINTYYRARSLRVGIEMQRAGGLGLRVSHEGAIRVEVGSGRVELGRMERDSLAGLWAGGRVFS